MWWSLKEYYRPRSVGHMIRLLERFGPRAAVLAGGTQLVADQHPQTEVLLDLSALNLNYVKAQPRQVRLGALTSLQTLTVHPDVRELADGLLLQAAEYATTRPIRNRATVGGTLAVSDPAPELVLVLLLLDAQVVLRSPRHCVLDMADFLARRQAYLSQPALIVEVIVPTPPLEAGAALTGVRQTRGDRPIVSAAAQIERAGNSLQTVRLALGGVAPTPIRLREVEALLMGGQLDEAMLDHIEHLVENSVDPPADTRASAEYRRRMAGVTAARALRQAWQQSVKE